MVKLTPEQISQIKVFISKRGFTYPDVQLEIIDHVASRVEELMTEDSGLNLNAAISITHGEFGVMGFSVFEDGMISAMRKKYFSLFCTTFLSWFNWKYLPLIVGFIYLLDRLYVIVNSPVLFVVWGCGILFLAICLSIGLFDIKYKKYRKLLTRKVAGGYVSILGVIYNVWNFAFLQTGFYEKGDINTVALIFSVLITLVILLYLTVKKISEISIENCVELDEKYQLLNS